MTRLQKQRRKNQQEKFSEEERNQWKRCFIRDNLQDFCLFISSCPVIDMSFRTDYVESRDGNKGCLLYTSPSPRDRTRSRMPSSA